MANCKESSGKKTRESQHLQCKIAMGISYFANIGTKIAEKFHHDSGASLNQLLASVNPGTPVLDQVAFSEEQTKLKLFHIKQKTGGPGSIARRLTGSTRFFLLRDSK